MEIREEGRAAFAAVAEAVGVTTVNVIVVRQDPRSPIAPMTYTVIYTRGVEGDMPEDEALDLPVYRQQLQPDADGILVKFGDEFEIGTGRDFLEFLKGRLP